MNKKYIFFLFGALIFVIVIFYNISPTFINGDMYVSNFNWTSIATTSKAITKKITITSDKGNSPFYVVIKDSNGAFVTKSILINPGQNALIMNQFKISTKDLIIQAKTLKKEEFISISIKMSI